MQKYGDAFAGVAFHCYAGSVSGQDTFHNQAPSKVGSYKAISLNDIHLRFQEIYFTECSGTFGSDWWTDIKACVIGIGSCMLIDPVLNIVVHG